jgi:ABC-type dipeptide/oligopeptide/nickel transport system permease subunit
MIGWAFARGGLINELWWWLFPPGIGIMITVFSLVALEFFLLRNRGEVSLDL